MQTEMHKIRNWSDYNRALIQRGSINFWIEQEYLKKWFSSYHSCKSGRPETYSDEAILDGWERERDASLAEIEGFGGGEEGRKLWKIFSGYHERSLVETSMFRIKKMMGENLKSRLFGSQQTEAICKCLVINKMNRLGLPKGKWVRGV